MIQRALGRNPRPFIAPPVPPEPLELDACYRYCEALARARHHNFPVASFFVPDRLRRHIWALYAFARTADDFADEPQYAGRRARELDRWEGRLESCFHGVPADHPVFCALADTIRRFDLPITPFLALLSGFRMDLDVQRYATAQDLRNYTSLAAEPIGHLMLYISGYRDPAPHRYADDLATGLAFATFWQDVSTDLERGRIYLPLEDLRHFDVSEEHLRARRRDPGVAALIGYEVARTRALFERARPVVDLIGPELAVELALVWHGGMRILDKIEDYGADVVIRRPRLSSVDKAQVVARALAWRGGTLGHRILR